VEDAYEAGRGTEGNVKLCSVDQQQVGIKCSRPGINVKSIPPGLTNIPEEGIGVNKGAGAGYKTNRKGFS